MGGIVSVALPDCASGSRVSASTSTFVSASSFVSASTSTFVSGSTFVSASSFVSASASTFVSAFVSDVSVFLSGDPWNRVVSSLDGATTGSSLSDIIYYNNIKSK